MSGSSAFIRTHFLLLNLKPTATTSPPLISVIIAVYNGAAYLEQTINSILAQSSASFELLVIDGGSTDGTVDIIKKHADDLAYWVSEPDTGIYNAWNKAVVKARGTWLCFVGSDDVLLPDALENYLKHIEANKLQGYEFISSVILLTDTHLKPLRHFGRQWHWASHKVEMRVAHVGALHHQQLFERYGLFDDTYKIAGDYELLLRPQHKLKASFLNAVTVLMRSGGASNTNLEVFKESLQAKIASGGRNKLSAKAEYYLLLAKFYLLKTIR